MKYQINLFRTPRAWISVVATSLLIAACGGGGGSEPLSTPPPVVVTPTPPPPPPPVVVTPTPPPPPPPVVVTPTPPPPPPPVVVTPTPPPPPAGSPALALFAGSLGGLGNIDGIGSAARFNFPQGVATDSVGNVYVADTSNHTIRKITPDGVVTALAGKAGVSGCSDGVGTAASFKYPRGIAVDSAGNVYVAESGLASPLLP